MKRIQQNLDELIDKLSDITSDWKDDHFIAVENLFKIIDRETNFEQIAFKILDSDFKAGKTLIRSFLSLSKDQFDLKLKTMINGSGMKLYQSNKVAFVRALNELGFSSEIIKLTSRQYTWKDIISEKLKSGRGSAIKGQRRGRDFEDEIEVVVKDVFGQNSYDTRCRFVGIKPESSEKTDFAIPSKSNPQVLIEAKAYGATGSKQTDIIGDVTRIVNEKRNDTFFLLATDGLTWESRKSDLAKLIELQNQGKIYRIYTKVMFEELREDLVQLKTELVLY
ncbi:MAG: DpnII family type II restriction endonuclease [Saprospiraceae bacterium]|nr:DpnII family type II restriction endonuclease [Saprospiraceae bacterium]